MKIIFELPFYSNTCGGVLSTISLAKEMGAELRFQRLTNEMPVGIGVKFTIGKTEMFPACDWAISYSDNPFFSKLFNVRRVKNVGIFMQSYGMSIEQERKNALNKKALVLCTTKKIEDAIKADGGNVYRIGHGFDLHHFYDKGLDRKNYLAIMYHHMETKQYDVAVMVADVLYDDGVIDGVITFGMSDGYNEHKHPKGLVKHYSHADKDGVSEVFNQCKAYLMPSISEGLNLTPIEATLCGCPSVLCSGAIGELFLDEINCLVVPNSVDEMYMAVKSIMEDLEKSEFFMYNMESVIYGGKSSWSDVADNLRKLL
jgi:glycosyltransferase involved in cell wall biosynthesis